MRRLAFGAVLVAGLAAAGHAAHPSLPPTRTAALLCWLHAGGYRDAYVPEPTVRESASAHGLHVRTWYSPVLAADLAGATVPFRPGAAMVKELYFAGTDQVIGWSVMRKVRRRSAGGRGWFFFETFDGETALVRGRGVGICVGCHADGTDFLLSTYRP